MIIPDDPEHRMRLALEKARLGGENDEVPVGAVIIDSDGRLLAAAHDERHATTDPTAHAEILAIRRAAALIADWRLENCSLYVTLEPCPMCAGALILARISNLYYGAPSPKSGSVESLTRLLDVPGYNHRVQTQSGILAEECSQVLSEYFQKKRR
ncbi:MAG: tRNA adenosine(34) deaminase TadA [Candidatus Sumerlaeia bacterium]